MNPKILNITCIFAVCLLVGQIVLSGWRATEGDKIAEIQNQISLIESENFRLKNQIYELTALENIHRFARLTNMQPAHITNLSSITVAMNR